MAKKVLKFLAGFVVGCLIMLAALIGMYFYMASREPASVMSGFEGEIITIAFISARKTVSFRSQRSRVSHSSV